MLIVPVIKGTHEVIPGLVPEERSRSGIVTVESGEKLRGVIDLGERFPRLLGSYAGDIIVFWYCELKPLEMGTEAKGGYLLKRGSPVNINQRSLEDEDR